MKIFSYLKLMAMALFILCSISSCQKNEFMPDPVGEAIQAPDYPPLATLLDGDYSLFKSAWEKAEMDNVLSTDLAQAKLTFFIPSNKGMEEAGFNSAAIQAASKDALQELLRYHLINNAVDLEQLKIAKMDLSFGSLLTHPKFLEGMQFGGSAMATVPYRYQHSLTVRDDQLLDNGLVVKVNKEAAVTQGVAFFIDQVLQKPEKQMIDVLREDSRFSLYLKAMEITNKAYEEDYQMNFWPNFEAPLSYYVDWDYFIPGTFHSSTEYPRHIIRFTLFAPTNEAFRQLGITNEADLEALYHRVPAPATYYQILTPVDSLLRYQHTGRSFSTAIIADNWIDLGIGVQKHRTANNAVLYADMLDDALLSGYILEYENPRGSEWVQKYIPYRFGKSANQQVTVKHIDAKPDPATIVEENINTIQGPIHVVDKILVPKEFSMWHKK